jgi:hypothetical protein
MVTREWWYNLERRTILLANYLRLNTIHKHQVLEKISIRRKKVELLFIIEINYYAE